MFFHHYDIKNKYQSPFTRAANYTLKPLESPSYANIFNQIKQNQTADTDNIPQQYSYLQNNSYISGTGQLNTQRGYNDYMANQYNSDRNMNVNNPYKKEFFYRIQSPRNPFLPHFDQEEQKESPRLRNIKNGVSGGYEGNENKYGQIKSFNAFNYDELNSSLNHQDQAKLNRAINMGWIPQKQVDQFRSDKNKQLLYQQELQKQINEKQELKMQQLRKQKLEEEKLDRKIMKQLNIPKLDLNSVQMVQKQNQIYDSNVYSKTPNLLSTTFKCQHLPDLIYQKHITLLFPLDKQLKFMWLLHPHIIQQTLIGLTIFLQAEKQNQIHSQDQNQLRDKCKKATQMQASSQMN